MKIQDGFFITFEGVEGCGKSTQARLVVERLLSMGYEAVHTREPGGTQVGMKVRAVLLDPDNAGMDPGAELMLYSADRAEHVGRVIRPALEAGKVVVCDRYADATVAYQGYGRGLDLGVIDNLTRLATGGLMPELTILLDLPVELGLARAIGRNSSADTEHEGRFEAEAVEFHQRVRKGYFAIAEREPGRVKIVDATGSVDEVAAAVRDAVEKTVAGRTQ